MQFPGLGLEFTLDRVAFTVFGMPIYWYGILIATGLALAIVFAFSHARRFGIDSDRMVDVILIGTVCAVIGGRAFYVATAPFEYASFAEMLDIRLGGVAIYGAVIAALCIWLALRKKYKDKPLTVTYTALVKEDGRQVPYEFSWLSGETPPTDAEMKAEIERRRAARAAEETAQAEEKAPETEESGGASGVPEQREAEADTQAAPEEEQAAPAQEAAADAAEKDGSDAEPKE